MKSKKPAYAAAGQPGIRGNANRSAAMSTRATAVNPWPLARGVGPSPTHARRSPHATVVAPRAELAGAAVPARSPAARPGVWWRQAGGGSMAIGRVVALASLTAEETLADDLDQRVRQCGEW
jgi:hypothetical protein